MHIRHFWSKLWSSNSTINITFPYLIMGSAMWSGLGVCPERPKCLLLAATKIKIWKGQRGRGKMKGALRGRLDRPFVCVHLFLSLSHKHSTKTNCNVWCNPINHTIFSFFVSLPPGKTLQYSSFPLSICFQYILFLCFSVKQRDFTIFAFPFFSARQFFLFKRENDIFSFFVSLPHQTMCFITFFKKFNAIFVSLQDICMSSIFPFPLFLCQ